MIIDLVSAIEDASFLNRDERVNFRKDDENFFIAVAGRAEDLPQEEVALVLSSRQPALTTFDFGLRGGWYSLIYAADRLDTGTVARLDVAGTEVDLRRNVADELEISSPLDQVLDFQDSQTPQGFRQFSETLKRLSRPSSSDERGPREEFLVTVGGQGESEDFVVKSGFSGSTNPGDRGKEVFRSAIQAAAEDLGCSRHDQALGYLLIEHLVWQLEEWQGLGEYLNFRILGNGCQSKAILIRGDRRGFRNFKDDLEDKSHVYAFAATPKETVQRISEVAARRSTLELTAVLSALRSGAAIDNVTELMLDSERILHGISRKPLVVGFTNGLHFGDKSSKIAHAGWMIGPKFKLTENVWHMPWNKGFRFQHTPIQNNLSVAISVPSWWEHADVAVTTYWRSRKNKTKGEARRHRHRIELPGTTAGITDALLQHQLPEVSEPAEYEVVQGASARLLLTGRNLWRSTRVTLGGQIADRITVLPALAGLVAEFDTIKEIAGPDGKTPTPYSVYVWTSTGKRLAGEAKVHPAKPVEKKTPKIELTPPYFVKKGKLTLKLTQGDAPKGNQLELQARVLNQKDQRYGEAVNLGVPTYDAATKTYSLSPTDSILDSMSTENAKVQLLLVVSPEAGGKIVTVSAEKLGVYYKESPKITWKNPAKLSGKLELTTPDFTETAFPSFSTETRVSISSPTPGVATIALKNGTWAKKPTEKFVLKSDIEWTQPTIPTLQKDDEVEIRLTLEDAELKKALPFGDPSPAKVKVP